MALFTGPVERQANNFEAKTCLAAFVIDLQVLLLVILEVALAGLEKA